MEHVAPEGSEQAVEPKRSRRGRLIVLLVALAFVVLVTVVVLLVGRGFLALGARRMAGRQINAGAITAARQWLAWSAWLDPSEGRTDLMQATCLRHLRELDGYAETLQSAEQKGAPATLVSQELKLGLIQAGKMDEGAEDQLGQLIEAGISPREVATAYVYGFLVRDDPEEAKKVLDAWAVDSPDESQLSYMEGVYWQWLGDSDQAQKEFQNALTRQPRHELARTALANLLEDQDRLDEALDHYIALVTRFPASEAAQVGLARLLRKLGGIDEAQAVLESLAARPQMPPGAAVEMAQVKLESADYEQAAHWFRQATFDPGEDYEILSAVATTFALTEEITRAERLFDWVDAAYRRLGRIDDLRDRLAVDPGDGEARNELQYLFLPSSTVAVDVSVFGTDQASEDRPESPAMSALDLYAQHCGACHGANGDGNGRAARHLFPRPSDLRTGRSRLVSTTNAVPTPDDLESVIRRGMPGTSMRSFENLSQDQRKLLVREVQRLNREGIREQFINQLRNEEEEIDEHEVRQVVELCITPGEAVPIPRIGPADSRAIASGKDTYFKLACNNCHGDDGVGAWYTPSFDDKGRPSPPRDLVHEPFKGGHEPESIYLRIFLGMPGTPHPGCWNLPEDEVIDLVHYCRSLSREPKRDLTNHQRAKQAAGWAYLSALGGSPSP